MSLEEHTAKGVALTSFRSLFDQLGKSILELDAAVQQFDVERGLLASENRQLREQLKKHGITPRDMLPEDAPLEQYYLDVLHKETTSENVDERSNGVENPQFSNPEIADKEEEIFKIHEGWRVELDTKCEIYMHPTDVKNKEDELSLAYDEIKRRKKWTVIFPNSNLRILWDVTGLVLICYDLLAIPFTQAFDPPDSMASVSMDWITLCFWTGDMLQGFFLGYFQEGEYVDDQLLVLMNYFKTWFLVDCVVVLPDWVTKLLDDGDAGTWGELGKILKGARAIRVMRLLRLAKLQRIINIVFDKIQSEYTFIVLNLLKMLLCVLVMNHLIACAWYGLAIAVGGPDTWIAKAGMIDDHLDYKYLTALHWSLTQFTPAGMDISARNVLERIFSIVVLFFAMIAFSSIVASITSSMTNLRNMKGDQTKQLWLLRKYLRQHCVSRELSDRIAKFLEHRRNAQDGQIKMNQLQVLNDLSEALRNELLYSTNSSLLVPHPFFRAVDEEMQIIMHKICSILKGRTVAEKETIFTGGDTAMWAFFTRDGKLSYKPIHGESFKAREKECISEAALWVHWRHQGDLVALCGSEIFMLPPAAFLTIMQTHPTPWFYGVSYAQSFVDFIGKWDPYSYTDFIRDENFQKRAMMAIANTRSTRWTPQK